MYGATVSNLPATTQTPEQYWQSLSPAQQTYLRNIVLKKNLILLYGVAALGAALMFIAHKKKLI